MHVRLRHLSYALLLAVPAASLLHYRVHVGPLITFLVAGLGIISAGGPARPELLLGVYLILAVVFITCPQRRRNMQREKERMPSRPPSLPRFAD
jgi:hypothetical protein